MTSVLSWPSDSKVTIPFGPFSLRHASDLLVVPSTISACHSRRSPPTSATQRGVGVVDLLDRLDAFMNFGNFSSCVHWLYRAPGTLRSMDSLTVSSETPFLVRFPLDLASPVGAV